MAREVYQYGVPVPAGTPQVQPQVTPLPMPPRIVRRVEWRVPAGAAGQLGFQLGLAGRQLIPFNQGAYIIADDEAAGWDMEGLPTSGAWQLIAYNLGQFPHTIYVRLLVDLPGEPADVGLVLVPDASLDSSGSEVPPPPDGSTPPADGSIPPPPPAPDLGGTQGIQGPGSAALIWEAVIA